MATTNLNFNRGSDFPAWQWLPPAPLAYNGFDSAYDGNRYIYYLAQVGITTLVASTTQLWRFDTWNHGHQYLAVATSGNYGMGLVYDEVRNIVIVNHGVLLTSWQVFNLNNTALSVSGVSCPAWVMTTITPVLPAACSYGSTIEQANPASIPAEIESGTFTTGTTTTSIFDTTVVSSYMATMLYLQLRVTSGTRTGDKRIVSAVVSDSNLTLSAALGGTPSVGDSYVLELPQGTATATFNTTTLADSTMTWVANSYSNHDVLITGGTGAGQRRRIASNTPTVLTLSGAVTGNANTGPWSVAPDATSTYKIQPSSDFMYYQAGASTGIYKIDLATGASATTWTTLTVVPAATSNGANVLWNSNGPFFLTVVRGNATATVYLYDIGLNSYTTPTLYTGAEVFGAAGAVSSISSTYWKGQRKMIILQQASTRLYALDFPTRMLEPLGTVPYAAPGAYEGRRIRQIRTADGVDWLYVWRAGGQEFFRVPLEWGLL